MAMLLSKRLISCQLQTCPFQEYYEPPYDEYVIPYLVGTRNSYQDIIQIENKWDFTGDGSTCQNDISSIMIRTQSYNT